MSTLGMKFMTAPQLFIFNDYDRTLTNSCNELLNVLHDKCH